MSLMSLHETLLALPSGSLNVPKDWELQKKFGILTQFSKTTQFLTKPVLYETRLYLSQPLRETVLQGVLGDLGQYKLSIASMLLNLRETQKQATPGAPLERVASRAEINYRLETSEILAKLILVSAHPTVDMQVSNHNYGDFFHPTKIRLTQRGILGNEDHLVTPEAANSFLDFTETYTLPLLSLIIQDYQRAEEK